MVDVIPVPCFSEHDSFRRGDADLFSNQKSNINFFEVFDEFAIVFFDFFAFCDKINGWLYLVFVVLNETIIVGCCN